MNSELVITHSRGIIRLLQLDKLTIEQLMKHLDGLKNVEINIIYNK